MQFAKENNLPGLLLTVDFEKAFDSISFGFISACLKLYNFSDELIRWVEILLKNFRAVINHCGNISSSFDIGRGCRQGDPIASILFILSIEILAHKLRSDRQVHGLELRRSEDINSLVLRHLLEIYADDLTVFLEPTSQNLLNIINILKTFFQVSGLKVSASKSKAVWFGSRSGSTEVLCPYLGLQWAHNFELLGIKFDSNLEHMHINFTEKIEKIERVLKNWSFRYLTPFGKVTIVKTFGLSKLSHVALIMPNPPTDMIKRIERIFYNFLWGGKSEKVRREDTKLPIKQGGLSMPDIQSFWTAFKFSWIRRLLTTDAFWPQLLLEDMGRLMGGKVSAPDLLQCGVSKLQSVSKEMHNPFWKQVLACTKIIADGALDLYPEKIMQSPLYHNPAIIRRRPIKPTEFPELGSLGLSLSNFHHQGTNELMSWEDFQTRHNINISYEKYIDIRFTIKNAIAKLGIRYSKINPAFFPEKPLLVDIALSVKKGCSKYYKIINFKRTNNTKLYLREQKWHEELQQSYSLQFWNNARHFYASINFDHNLKWLQFQIVRNSLQTNYIIHHFKPHIPPTCSYCCDLNSLEKISHLFWTCPEVSRFLAIAATFLNSIGMNFAPSKNQFLFGSDEIPFYEKSNFSSLVLKRYIWITKFKTVKLSLVGFKSLLKGYILDLIMMLKYKNLPDVCLEWENAVVNLN